MAISVFGWRVGETDHENEIDLNARRGPWSGGRKKELSKQREDLLLCVFVVFLRE